jgi:Ubiquitin carboxyl-terminal hydrolase, family 1
MPKHWIPLESNPEVITEFAGRIGLDSSAWAFHDVFGLDDEVGALGGGSPFPKRARCRHAVL